MKEANCIILCGSQREKVTTRGIVGSISWENLIDNFDGFNTPAIKTAFNACDKNDMIIFLIYETLDGEIRHRIAMGKFTEDQEEIKDIINEISHDLDIEFELIMGE